MNCNGCLALLLDASSAAPANVFTFLGQIAPTALWVGLIAVLAIAYRTQLNLLISHLILRLKLGASLKVGVLEVGAVHIAPDSPTEESSAGISVEPDDGTREAEHVGVLNNWRWIAVVHKISPSKVPSQRYDALIYLTTYGDHSLLGVKEVSYYFGPWWNSKIFTTSERANSFALATSARGPFLCVARVRFNDGNTTSITRYIDFEMGQAGPSPL